MKENEINENRTLELIDRYGLTSQGERGGFGKKYFAHHKFATCISSKGLMVHTPGIINQSVHKKEFQNIHLTKVHTNFNNTVTNGKEIRKTLNSEN